MYNQKQKIIQQQKINNDM